ncbi:hypothetical protein R1sor_008999 [Riccia sorocarpa]|uniref:Uncharacterized protein n=1 Tax=Riccia sorocarpa TaxID=122646 RepID=A0ABD3H7T3_9MARC
MLGRTKEQEEPGIVWDTAIQRLNMPEGRLHRTDSSEGEGELVIDLLSPCPECVEDRQRWQPNIHWCFLGAFLVHLHLKNEWLMAEERSLYEEADPYSKISADYSSSEEEDDTSDEEEEKTEEAKEVGEVVKDTESDEDEDQDQDNTQDEGAPAEGQKLKSSNTLPPPSPTSPN